MWKHLHGGLRETHTKRTIKTDRLTPDSKLPPISDSAEPNTGATIVWDIFIVTGVFIVKNLLHFFNTSVTNVGYYIRLGSRLGGVVVSVLATRPKVCGFKTWPRRWIFKGDKPQHTFLSDGK
jgi:hypothetical protein